MPSKSAIHAGPGSFGLNPTCDSLTTSPSTLPLEEPCLKLKNEAEAARILRERYEYARRGAVPGCQ